MKVQKNKLAKAVIYLIACNACIPLASMASPPQDAADKSEKPAEAKTLDNVVVTANKRAENIQETPIAMSVYDGNFIKDRGVTDLRKLAEIAPDISLSSNADTLNLSIRGISSVNSGDVDDPAIAVATDGVFLNQNFAIDASMYDVDRVEVLRGPQGTLYGRNATGGVVNIITAAPVDSYEGFVNLTAGNYSTQNVDGAVNLPVSDTFAMRLAFASYNHDGYRHNGDSGRSDDEDTKSIRWSGLWKPTDNLSVLARYQKTHKGGAGQGLMHTPLTYNDDGAIDHSFPDNIGSGKRFAMNVPAKLYLDQDDFKLKVDYALDFANLTYLGGFNNTKYSHTEPKSADLSNQDAWTQGQNNSTTSHELRLSSKDDNSRIFWQTGIYYFNSNGDLDSYKPSKSLVTGLPYNKYEYIYHIHSVSKAVFGQVQFGLTDKLKLTTGVRYTGDNKRRTGDILSAVDGNADPVVYNVDPITGVTNGKWKKFNYSADLTYQLNKKSMVYGKVSTGYRAGGFTTLSDYGPENVTAYEVGTKNQFFDNSLRLDASAYYYDYKDLQVTQPVVLASGVRDSDTLNAGKAKMYGADVDMSLLVGQNGTLNFTAAYLNTDLGNLVSVYNNEDIDVSGNRFPLAPTWSLAGSYEHNFYTDYGDFTANVSFTHKSKQYFQIYNFDSSSQKAYTVYNTWIKYAPKSTSPNFNWEVQGYVNNVTNKRVLAFAEESVADGIAYSFQAPRTYGVKLSVYW